MGTRIRSAVLICLLVAVFAVLVSLGAVPTTARADEGGTTAYGVKVQTEDADRGLVSYSYQGGAFTEPHDYRVLTGTPSATVAVKAEAKYGWHFKGWEEDGLFVSADNPYSFALVQNRNLTALFTQDESMWCPPPESLWLDGEPLRGYASSASDAPFDYTNSYGKVRLELHGAASDSAKIFYKWFDGFCSTHADVDAADIYLNMSSGGYRPAATLYEGEITAPKGEQFLKFVVLDELEGLNFKKCSGAWVVRIERGDPRLLLTSSNADWGTVQGGGDYEVGTQVTATATPKDGYLFKHWLLGSEVVNTSATYSFVLDDSTALTAVFEVDPDIAINAKNSPDAIFRAYVAATFDADGNGKLSETEISAARKVDCAEKGISCLKGVEHLSALEELYCNHNDLRALDLSGNPALRVLRVQANYNLGKLDVSGNTALEYLRCGGCGLASLDVSGNPALSCLECTNNALFSLDVRRAPALNDAVQNGEKELLWNTVDYYHSSRGRIYADAGVNVVSAPYYSISTNSPENGQLSVSQTTAMEGASITVVAQPASGYEVAKIAYTIEGGSEVDITADAAFAMPAANVVVNAEFKALPPTEPLALANGVQQTWVAGARAEIRASAANLADALGEVVVAWEWQYSKTPENESSWKKSGAAVVAADAECALVIPECTAARKAPMAWRVVATTNLGRSATSEPQSLHVPEGPALKPAGEFAWVASQPVEISVAVDGLDAGETVVSYQWYYSKDGKTFKRSGAAASQAGNAGELLSLAIPSCTEARKPPMSWSVRITTSTGRTSTSEGSSSRWPTPRFWRCRH